MAMHDLTTKTKARLFKFDSMADVKEYIDPDQAASDIERSEFVGREFKGWEDVDVATESAWDHGAEVLKAYIERLADAALPVMKSRMRHTEWSYDDGDEIDTDRMAQGLAYRRRVIRETSTGPGELTVIIDTSTPFFHESDDVLWRGGVAVAMTKYLEERGYRCEVWCVNGSNLFADQYSPVLTATCLKRCEDPLDVSTLINVVSGWYYRCVSFTLLNTICYKEGRPMSMGYGRCATPQPKDLDAISTDPLRMYSSGVYTFNGALQMMIGEVNRIIELVDQKNSDSDDQN